MKNKEIEESIKRIKEIVDFYKLNDENNYDYSDDVLISMKNLLSYIEQLENKIKNLKNQVNTINNNNEELKRRLKIVQQKRDTHKAVRYKLENNRDKAIEILNKWEKENINPVFRKGLLKILKGDSDE